MPHFTRHGNNCSADRIAPDIDRSATSIEKPIDREDNANPFERQANCLQNDPSVLADTTDLDRDTDLEGTVRYSK